MKSFSWTLALRYLNPLRAFVSVITLLSLIGVAFGVMVLIVVLSVHAGFEKNLKEILLGSSPHLTVSSAYQGQGIAEWQEMEKRLASRESITGASALVEGFVLLDTKGWNSPVQFRGVNTDDPTQVEALEGMLEEGEVQLEARAKSLVDLESAEKAEMSQGEGGAVISSQLAGQLGLRVGDPIRLLASSNLDRVIEAYRTQEQGRAYEVYKTQFDPFSRMMNTLFQKEGDREVIKVADADAAYRLIQDLIPNEGQEAPPMRSVERQEVIGILELLNDYLTQEEGNYYFEEGIQAQILEKLKTLEELDLEKADLNSLKEIQEFVLPKELQISGIYHDTPRARGPQVYVSLTTGQELRGLDEGLVESIGLRTVDPYRAAEIQSSLQENLGDDWLVGSWMEQHAAQFQLVKTEKIMMSFMLSFLILISAFSVTAVMYTMTLQKRQEIGVMKALGASPLQIVNVFAYQGLVVGVGGALLGVGLGLLAVESRESIVDGIRLLGVDPFPANFHGMSELPAQVIPLQIGIIVIVAVILCLLAALIPALLAAFRDPAKISAKSLMKFWRIDEGEKVGPIEDYELRELIKKGEVTSETLVWHEGAEGWVRAEEVSVLKSEFRIPEPPPLPESVTPPSPPVPFHPLRRFFARWFDLTLYQIIVLAVLVLSGSVLMPKPEEVSVWLMLLRLLPLVFFETILLSAWGTTPGKWLLGLRVRDQEDQKISAGAAAIRFMRVIVLGFGLFFHPIFIIACHLMGLWFGLKRGAPLWDLVPGHQVLDEPLEQRKVIFYILGMIAISALSVFLMWPELEPMIEEAQRQVEAQRAASQSQN